MYVPLKMRPGIDTESTPLLNESGWSFSAGVRFFQSYVQKTGGWAHLNISPLVGYTRGMHAWADLLGNPYIAAGSSQRLQLFSGGTITDITPIRKTVNHAVDFSTVINTPTVTIHDVAHGALAGDWINLVVPVAVGGLVLVGYYQIATVVDADNYTVTAASNATATVNNGGAVPSFTSVNTSASLTVNLAAHGYVATNVFTVQVSTNIAGFVLSGDYSVFSVTNANAFVIKPGGNATSSTTVSENGGNARIQYLLPSGQESASVGVGSGAYGAGLYGDGVYGGAFGAATTTPLREWFLDNFGQDLIGNYTRSPLYLWTPPAGAGPAIPIDTTNFPGALDPPVQVGVSFVAAPQQMVIALACDDPVTTNFSPLLVRWSDASDFTDWRASSTNQAGSYLLPSGSTLVGGVSAPNFIVLWTDIEMWLMNYLGGSGLAEAVWGFNKVATGVNILAARAAGVHRNIVYWPSSNGFFAFNGNAVQPIPCPVWDKFWFNLDRLQVEKISAQVNSWFGEISWAFASASGNGEVDSRITLNLNNGAWTYDDAPTLTARTAWIDDNVYGAPIGADLNGLLQQHEVSNDADGQPLASSVRTGWFSVQEGTLLAMMERLSADLIVTGTGALTVQVTVYAQDYPTGPVRTYGPYNWNPSSGPPFSIVRARGRFMSIQISSSGLGGFWRLGNLRYTAQQAGRRP